ncbi:hypothetical protein RISK_004924 [Rhodopirellula islandica]|uniref:Uncharacterized protein n=1 Tax=Rhodopirellula islandica TaxID=595434 RepID=A0A0J1EBP0_RHOIS|nr:hypothetical protein RISK_004924 [Rhodopirellula islandica]
MGSCGERNLAELASDTSDSIAFGSCFARESRLFASSRFTLV